MSAEGGPDYKRLAAGALLVVAVAAAMTYLSKPSPSGESGATAASAAARPAGHISFTVESGGAKRRATSGERVDLGDVLRFAIITREPQWPVLLSWSERERGKVLYAAATPSTPSTDEQPLPVTYTVDAKTSEIQFWGLLCAQKVDAAALDAKLDKEGEHFATPPECQRTTFIVSRGPR